MTIAQAIKRTPLSLAASLCTSAVLLCSAPAFAQDTQPPMAQQSAGELSDQQLQSFVQAHGRVSEIAAKWNSKLERQGATQEDVVEARESAQREMAVAVESSGLSVEEYNQIALAIQSDPQLQQRLRGTQPGN